MAKKLKDIVKKNPEPARGTNYVNPSQLGQYSATNQVAEDGSLSQYLKAKGINPNFVSKATKISHAKSNTFKKWRMDHKFEEVEYVSEDALLDRYLSAHGINPKFATKDVKISHSKSKQFLIWKQHHMQEDAKPEQTIGKTLSKTPMPGTTPTHVRQSKIAHDKAKNREIFPESKTIQGTALDKFRQDAAERAKKHAEIEKKQSKTGEGMTSAIDRLEKSLNKKETVVEHGDPWERDQHGKSIGWKAKEDDRDIKAMRADVKKYPHGNPNIKIMKASDVVKSVHKTMDKILSKEEVEQIDEISKSTLASYKDKSTASLKNAQANRDAAEPGKHMSKGFADLHKKSDEIAKKRVKGLKGYLQRKVGMKPVSEDNFADPNAATQSPFDGANNTDDTHDILPRKRGMSKTLKTIKSVCKPVKEETYDWEKDDKNQTSPGKPSGKNPKLSKEDPNALPDGEPKARAVMSGGTTMTGEKRDTVEIDPQMKSRPDLNGNKKDDGMVNKKVENK